MEARLNRSVGAYSAGTRVTVDMEDYEACMEESHLVPVDLTNPPYTGLLVLEDDITYCRPMTEDIPVNYRYKRRATKRAIYNEVNKLVEKSK